MTYEDDYYSCCSEESDYNLAYNKIMAAEFKKSDKNYQRYTIRVPEYYNSKGKLTSNAVIEDYGSGIQGTLVRNAVTGYKYNIVVGSSNEDILFKVIESSGRNKRRDPLMLYYDSPEQYENHHRTTVSTEVKQKWNQRFLEARMKLETN
jgi:hypothetical protein